MPTRPDQSAQKFRTRALAAIGRSGLTLLFVVTAGLAVIGGRTLLAERAAAIPQQTPAPASRVVADRIAIVDHYMTTRRFSGQLEARQRTDLSFEQPGTIVEIAVREGDTVKAGQIIARLDTRLLLAERARLLASRDATLAQVELARRTNERQTELNERGFAPGQTVDDTSLRLVQFQALAAEIDAALRAVDISLDKAELRAPYAGVVGARNLDVGSHAAPGAAVVSLTETAPARFRAGLDPDLARALSIGDGAAVEIGGRTHASRLASLSPELDLATRSRAAWFEIESDLVLPDRTPGTLLLTQRIDLPGAWVPLAALRSGPRATWLLTTVRDGTVSVEAAEIVHLDGDQAFVRGTFEDGMLYLPGGHHRVVPGQGVDLVEDTAWAR